MPLVDALLFAGGVPGPADPLYPLTRGQPKALLEVAGKPMIQWVLDALGAARTVRRVIVVGDLSPQPPSLEGKGELGVARFPPSPLQGEGVASLTGMGVGLTCPKPLHFLPSRGSLVHNLLAGARWLAEDDPAARYGLLVSSDLPTLTPEAVDWSVEAALQTDHDGYYSVIARAVMEARFPDARRSYFRLKDGAYTAGDLALLAVRLATEAHPVWQQLVEARKNIVRQAQLIGPGLALRFITRQLTLAEAERRISARLGVRGRALVCPYAEAGMDVDKPHHYEIMRRELEKRSAAN